MTWESLQFYDAKTCYGGVDIMRTTDMVMHVDEILAEESRRNLERTITSQRGVLDARFNEQRPHLMLVSYDRERTTSFDILAVMTGQRLCAERIG
jgi:hypothetical protein